MRLKRLLESSGEKTPSDHGEAEIRGIAYDSRKVEPGFLFVALRGHALDGHAFIGNAVENGAAAVVGEDIGRIESGVPAVKVRDSRAALSRLAAAFYGRPFEGMRIIGITGTNGKTTTSYFLESIFRAGGGEPGVIGTIEYRFGNTRLPAPVTTPESLDLMRILREMADSGVTHAVMEVSSHALDQERVRGCPFDMAVFTNISRDHLDYHASMADYFRAKSRLFTGLADQAPNRPAVAVINTDDPKGRELVRLTRAEIVTYGLSQDCHVRADRIEADRDGLRARLLTPEGSVPIRASLVGRFNVYNILGAAASALKMGIDLETIARGIASLPGVPGRMQRVAGRGDVDMVIDYAHTPEALTKALEALRPLTRGRLMTVFGCGGDRDRGKRRDMGLAAGTLSDVVFVTSDNPRTEDPDAIMSGIEAGVREAGLEKIAFPPSNGSAVSGYVMEPDRAAAIHGAVSTARGEDLILIAGKGHEDYQIIGTEKRHFDDREAAERAVQALGGNA
ncbi:MAG: UDP-N-acetylmuramoyl-L-alanyl-D-glutamate--2,6-diaminopimelate ligase [Deltaproteobacteria bacterium]|nr:UDP-N-acetylmuramoyl-L-alanyl-D-glutamate--2,6-diaminopimelate ligase [Deltaproteobacteria bacterium]